MIDLTNILVTADNNQKYICDADTDKKYLCDAEDRMITFAGERGETGPQGPQGPQGEPGEVTEAELTAALALKANVADLGTMSAESASDYYTKTATDTLLSAKANTADLGSLANQDTVNYQTEVTNKPTLGALADHDTVNYSTEVTNKPTLGTMSAESASDYYDKTEVYDKAEVDMLINGSGVVGEKTVSGSIVTFETTLAENLGELKVGIDPVQDLHGYDSPWPAGGGKNLLPMTLANIKTINSTGTWSGNTYTLYDVAYTVNTDDGGNVVSIKVNGTASAYSLLRLYNEITFTSNTILSGCDSGGSYSGYKLEASGGTTRQDVGYGVTIPANEAKERITITVPSGTTVTNAMFYPMIRLATDADATFAPYSNICPITGHTSAVVTRTGKNLFKTATTTETDITFTANTDGSLTLNGTASATRLAYFALDCTLPVGTYTLSGRNPVASNSGIILRLLNGYTTLVDLNLTSVNASTSVTVTQPINKLAIRVGSGAQLTNFVIYPQLESGSTVTSFEPYTAPTTLPISWQTEAGTVYGGTVDVLTGLMTVTHAIRNLYGSGTSIGRANTNTANQYRFQISFSGIASVDNSNKIDGYSNVYKSVTATRTYLCDNGISGTGNGSGVYIYDAQHNTDTASDFSTYLESIGAYVVYPLAEPLTVQLSASTLQLLQGDNVVWASTGNIESLGYYTNDTAEAINDTRQMMADTTTTMTAPRNLTTNEFVIVNNRLYKVTANVASGSALVVGTNVTETTVAEVLTALLNA